jgi:MoaA/NifB/PqqE/SkfB family radical SAM enzyme
MNKQKKMRFGASERVSLETVLPLDYPLSLVCDPSSLCNFRCRFCPQSTSEFHAQKLQLMKFDTFKKIVDDLQASNAKIKTLSLAKMGEPLINKKLPDMIRYAKDSGVFSRVVTISNGSLLNPDFNTQLIDAGLDRILISVQGLSSEKYFEICKVKVDFDDFIANLTHFYQNRKKCIIHIKGFYNSFIGEEDKFYEIFSDICDEISVEHVVPFREDMSYKEKECSFGVDRYGDSVNKVVVCPLSFYSLHISPDGVVNHCCYSYDCFTIGNIHDDNLIDLWNSDKIRNHRLMQLRGKRFQHPICKNCPLPQIGIPKSDVIDKVANILIEQYVKK